MKAESKTSNSFENSPELYSVIFYVLHHKKQNQIKALFSSLFIILQVHKEIKQRHKTTATSFHFVFVSILNTFTINI